MVNLWYACQRYQHPITNFKNTPHSSSILEAAWECMASRPSWSQSEGCVLVQSPQIAQPWGVLSRGFGRWLQRCRRAFSEATSRMKALCGPQQPQGDPQATGAWGKKREGKWHAADPGECWAMGVIMPLGICSGPRTEVGQGLPEDQPGCCR